MQKQLSFVYLLVLIYAFIESSETRHLQAAPAYPYNYQPDSPSISMMDHSQNGLGDLIHQLAHGTGRQNSEISIKQSSTRKNTFQRSQMRLREHLENYPSLMTQHVSLYSGLQLRELAKRALRLAKILSVLNGKSKLSLKSTFPFDQQTFHPLSLLESDNNQV